MLTLREFARSRFSLLRSLMTLADHRSRARLLKAKLAGRFGRAPKTISVRVKGKPALRLEVRPGTTDMGLLSYGLGAELGTPPEPVKRQRLTQICELGANSGMTMADLARRYPEARILGVEPDPENAALARRNVAAFGARCTVIEAAAWDVDGHISLTGESFGKLVTRPVEESGGAGTVVRALSVETLLAEHMPEGEVDYLHLDIVGSEGRLLTADAAWLDRVRSLRIQVYPENAIGGAISDEECERRLRAHGFEVTREVEWWGGTISGYRADFDRAA